MRRMKPLCNACGEIYSAKRANAGYNLCLPCGEDVARERKHTIAPMNKSNYIYISDRSLLKQLNPKFTTA